MAEDAKPWWQSRTLWANAVFAALTVLEANIGLIKDHFGPVGYVGALAVIAAVNAALRLITTQPLTLKAPEP